MLRCRFWLSRSGVESMILPSSGDLRRCWCWWYIDHSQHQVYRREARDVLCLQEAISTFKAMFLVLQAKEMQQMVKLEAEMDRRPATIVWNSRTQTEAAKPTSKAHPRHLNTKSMEENRLLCLFPFCINKLLPKTTDLYTSSSHIEFPWSTTNSYKPTKITFPVRQSLTIGNTT